MKIGVYIFPTDRTLQPVALARAVEERGFESLWFPEHSHIPTSRKTPWGNREDAPPLPEMYWRSHDPFVALAACAAATTSLRLGTGITLVAQRDPIWLAKQVASLDMISEGRLLFGVGYGWNKEEMANHGTDYAQRRAILRENVLAMQRIWTEDEPEFHGDHVDFDPIWAWPKPVQQPHPPIILGGNAGPRTMAHIVEFCDGWMPIAGRYDIVERIEPLRRTAEEAGRDPDSIEIGVFTARPKDLPRYREAGIARALLSLPPADPATVERKLEEYAPLVDEFRD